MTFSWRILHLVANYASIMPNIVTASKSENIARFNKNYMGCLAHLLTTVKKIIMAEFFARSFNLSMKVICNDLIIANCMVCFAKTSSQNNLLPPKKYFKQEVETLFKTVCNVVVQLFESI